MSKTSVNELNQLVRDLSNKLEQSEKMREEFVNASYDGYWDWHLQEDYEYMSPRFWEILGFDPKSKKHHPSEWKDLIFPEDLQIAKDNLKKHIESRGSFPYVQEVRYRHRDGSTVTVLCRGKVIEWDEEGNAVRIVGTHTDITHLKEQQEKILKQKNSLEKINKELQEFHYIASHDLQAPLRHVTSFLDILVDSLGDRLSAEEMQYIQTVQKAAAKMKHLIVDLLDFSRVSSQQLCLEEVDLSELFKEIQTDFEYQKKGDNIHFKIQQLPKIVADRKLMEKLIQHLIDNSNKYRQQDKDLTIEVNAQEKDNHWIFTFSDNGIGFKQEQAEEIFKIFHRLQESKETQGTGMGLAICKKILESHEGKIWAEGSPDLGASVYFAIPHLTKTEG